MALSVSRSARGLPALFQSDLWQGWSRFILIRGERGASIGRGDQAGEIGLLLEMVSDTWHEWAAGWKGWLVLKETSSCRGTFPAG